MWLAYFHVAVLPARGVPGEAHGVGLHVRDAELAHAHRRAQHRALQRAPARHRLVLQHTHVTDFSIATEIEGGLGPLLSLMSWIVMGPVFDLLLVFEHAVAMRRI